jgi:hemolysin activation/secretion protein
LGDFAKFNIDGRRLQRVNDNMNFLLSFSAQRAMKNLASAEKFSLGGPNAVRAYPVGEATGDDGLVVTGELRYIPPGAKVFGGDFILSGFIDYGIAKLNHEPLASDTENHRELSGYGVGLSLGRDGNFVLRSSIAWRITRTDPQSDTAERWPRVWVQGVKWF